MPSSSQDPSVQFLDIIADLATPTVWLTAFEIAEDHLRAVCPEGYNVEEIGALAWKNLADDDREGALHELFYTYWASVQQDAEEMVRWETERDTRQALKDQLALLQQLPEADSFPALCNIAALASLLVGGAA